MTGNLCSDKSGFMVQSGGGVWQGVSFTLIDKIRGQFQLYLRLSAGSGERGDDVVVFVFQGTVCGPSRRGKWER